VNRTGCTGSQFFIDFCLQIWVKLKSKSLRKEKTTPFWGIIWGIPPQVAVAPLVGAWIEIYENTLEETLPVSLPSWERGLK
jgi:hypothetical protein